MCIMDEPLYYGIGKGSVLDDLVPVIEGQLASDQGGPAPVPVIQESRRSVSVSGARPRSSINSNWVLANLSLGSFFNARARNALA